MLDGTLLAPLVVSSIAGLVALTIFLLRSVYGAHHERQMADALKEMAKTALRTPPEE